MNAFSRALTLVTLILLTLAAFSSIVKPQRMSRDQILTALQKSSNGFDMRGVVESEVTRAASILDGPLLTYDAAFWVGVGFGESLKQLRISSPSQVSNLPLTVGIGRDSRESGEELTRWLAGGLEAVGVSAYDVGLCTTPAMYLSCITGKSDNGRSDSSPWPFSGAISVTASHLPSQWNGFKFFTPDKPSNIGEEGIQSIINCCALAKFENLVPVASDFQNRFSGSFLSTYSEFLKKTVRDLVSQSWTPEQLDDLNNLSKGHGNPSQRFPLKGLKLCVNAGNGAGGFLASTLSDLGADTSSSLHLDPDGSFPNHIANPEDKKAIQCTADAVVASGADLGICLDTDADRVGLVEGVIIGSESEGGRLLNRNCLVALVSKVALRGFPSPTDSGDSVGVVVTDSATSNGLTQFIESLGGKHVRYKKGYRYVIEMGRSIEGCVAAVECSGHGAWRDNGWVDDGCYTAVKLVAELSLMRLEQRHAIAQGLDDAIEDSYPSDALCRLSDLLVGLVEPEESVELRYRVPGGPACMQAVTQQALDTLQALAVSPECNIDGSLTQSSYKWVIEKENFEGLRINFDFTVLEGTLGRVTGWCMLRPSLHEPILSMQIESDYKGGVREVARVLLKGCVTGSGGSSPGFQALEVVMDISALQRQAA